MATGEQKMFCPKCKAEYRQGFYKCTGCDVDLVYELPKEQEDTCRGEYNPEDKNLGASNFVKAIEVDNEGQLAFLKSIMEMTDIPYYFKSRIFRVTRPEQAPADLMIEESRLEEAKELLKDYNRGGQ